MKARENPYRSEQLLKIRYQFPDESGLRAALLQLEEMRYRAALVGPEGSGKTTLLEDLQKPLEARGKKIVWFRLTREFPKFSADQMHRLRQDFGPDDVLFFDGAEILGLLRFQIFRRQTRRAGGLIVTTHQPGYLPTLLHTQTSAALLGGILRNLDPEASIPDVSALFHRHRGNLREALREMYDTRMNPPSPLSAGPNSAF